MNKLNAILIGIICIIILFPLYGLLGFFYNHEVMVDGITVSAHAVMYSSIILSVFSLFLVYDFKKLMKINHHLIIHLLFQLFHVDSH